MSFNKAVINIGTYLMQRHLTLPESLASGNFIPTQSSTAPYLYSLGTRLQSPEGCLSHGSPERNSFFEPFSYAPSY
jgi:hypothetical protein